MSKDELPVRPPPKNLIRPAPKPPLIEVRRSAIVNLDRDKLPPQAVDLEEVILGAMMIDRKGVDEVIDILFPYIFFIEAHQIIFEAIHNLYKKTIAIDLLTVSEELKRMNKLHIVGGDYYLISLTQKVSSSAHIEFHARIVIQKYVLRELIKQSMITSEEAYHNDPDIFNMMDNIEKDIARIYKHVIQADEVYSSDAKKELYEKVAAVGKGEPPGIYTGISGFDNWGGGFRRREIIVIAARTGMGKTTAILAIASNGAFEKKIPIAFFSLEMAVSDLKSRLAAKGTGIPYNKIRDGKLTPVELSIVLDYYDEIDKSSLHLIERITIHEQIIKKIRELVTKEGIKIVMIDYVQLIRLARRTSDKTGDLGVITSDMKALANELNIPIVLIAQLSRKVDDRPGHRPVLADLKQSGSIEEDADTVIFLLRAAYYDLIAGIELPPQVIGKTEFIVAKGRSTGTRSFWTHLDFNRYDFRSLE